MPVEVPTLDDLHSAVQLACRPQNAWRIVAGRNLVLAMPRAWVLKHIEQVASDAIDLSEGWEYRRLLELAELLDVELMQRVAQLGLNSCDPDVREAAKDYLPSCETHSS